MQINSKNTSFLSLIWIAVKGFFWPVVVALGLIIYGKSVLWQPPDDWKDGAKSFFAILFFIMFFVGQYKRVEKQANDKDSFKNVNDQLFSLQELVSKIPTSQKDEAQRPKVPYVDAGNLLVESRTLLETGHILAALLQGGVAFEHSLRSFARHFKGEEAGRMPLHEIISRVTPERLAKKLHTLRVIRNRVVHISEEELADLQDATKIIAGYEWAVSELTRHISAETTG